MSNITIRGVKALKKGGIEITGVKHDEKEIIDEDGIQTVDVPRKFKETIYADPKGSFFNQLHQFKAHLLAFTGLGSFEPDAKYVKGLLALQDPRMEKYRITEVTISGDLEDMTLTIKGFRKSIYGKDVKFNAERIQLYGDTQYPFSGNLVDDWRAIESEAEAIYYGDYSPAVNGQYQFTF